MTPEFTRAGLLDALEELATISESGGEQGRVCVVGGAAMILAHSADRATRDIDAVIEHGVGWGSGGVWGLSGRCWVGVGRFGAQLLQLVGRMTAPRTRPGRTLRDLGPVEGIFAWLLIVAFGSLTVVVMFLVPWLTDMFEVCDSFHESANTPYGWTVACGSMVASLALARWIGSRPVTWLAYGSLPLHWLVWHWLLTPTDALCT